MNKKGIFFMLVVVTSCTAPPKQATIRLITLDPGHFHAALVQKTMYAGIDSTVHVYAPEGKDLDLHLARISDYNNRENSPTRWNEIVYKGSDFFDQMIAGRKGNVVVLSGNNGKKTEYILQSLQNGFHVLADKPMAIDTEGFEKLKKAFAVAAEKNLLLYDIMTERFEINTILQRELSTIPEIFGSLEKGNASNPAITKESVHYLYKKVSGKLLLRPAWFLDVSQQGEGLVDVMTHLVDLVQWECFPEQVIDYSKDINITNSSRWPTALSLAQFSAITQTDSFPAFLSKYISDTSLQVYCNGSINYKIKGVHARTTVKWDYKAPEGSGDTHYSIMRGSKCNLVIRQGKEENFKPVLYIEPSGNNSMNESVLAEAFKKVSSKFSGAELYKTANRWMVKLPEHFAEGHEAHFARVMENFLRYLTNKNLPEWEIPNMLAKYYTTTKALDNATNKNQ